LADRSRRDVQFLGCPDHGQVSGGRLEGP
jgi:hypothetical protein